MSKRLKTCSDEIDNSYHSASSICNYILNDPVLDFIRLKNEDLEENDTFLKFIMDAGINFEKKVVDEIEKIMLINNEKFVKIANDREDIRNYDKYLKTKQCIEEGVAVIYQGVLHGNDEYKAYGAPDLIIRTDVIKLFINNTYDIKSKYVIVDIKYSTLKFNATFNSLLNSGRVPAYKSQVMVYNRLLGIILGYTPEECYILGKGWKQPSSGRCNDQWNDCLGNINVMNEDEFYNNKIEKAFIWLTKLKTHGHTWTLNPPSVPELYPNMCNKNDQNQKEKKKIAKKIGEITQLWNVGITNRIFAHEQGIYSIYDPLISADVLGISKKTAKYKVIDTMLKFNQGKLTSNDSVYPENIKNNIENWQSKKMIEFFIDFETINIPYEDDNNYGKHNIFMIGLGVNIRIGDVVNWKYFNMFVPDINENYDDLIFNKMYTTMQNLIDEINSSFKLNMNITDANVYHWGSIENSIIKNIYDIYSYKYRWEPLTLVDLYKIFISEPIIIKDVYNYSLKTVIKGMISNGLIEFESWNEDLSNGLDAMLASYKIYKESRCDEIPLKLVNVIKYNEIDVSALVKIIEFLRNKKI